MASSQNPGLLTPSTALADTGRRDDGLHHICAVHYWDDDPGICHQGNPACRSLCGKDIADVVLTEAPLSGEAPCIVCFAIDEAP